MAIEVQLNDLLGLYTKAGMRILGRMSDRFINSFHQVFKVDEDLRHDYFRDKGISLARRHRYLQAQKLLTELHAEFPDDSEVSLYLGICCYKTGKLEESQLLLEAALEERPQSTRLRIVLGKVYEGLGEQQKLLQLLREDRDNDAENFDVQLKLAIALDRAGEVIEAIEVLQAALALNSDSLKAHRLIAVLYESQGESEQATVHHKRVIELENRDEEPESVEADSSDAEPQVTVVDEADDSDKKTASSEQERAA
ncbi:MAG: tetratricopeptide repeat protein [Gammaproteobacteria bacterium]|jgi:tetratricopeptide (TPR) repeat protein|nr:tetratricopeptide repeat protein [Gammaproteobacteria bacterium]MBT4605982.1 tetratricopeptide repeat protein [Thiotrichales bacterium]MBT3473885.1 tetratricopeptide repeat protein [Gammaproteobacteria bacterium]MBT3967991.1 tetratricopeptide repeat protein [Gammaproteobacteria bacterium]MBT4079388.1 tetratricopeptide repeat protein [Gammaproteobacteria bacterium]